MEAGKGRDFKSLSAVAPVLPTNLLPWWDDLQQFAAWLGREGRLAETFRQYDALRDEIRQRHASQIVGGSTDPNATRAPPIRLRNLDDPNGPAAPSSRRTTSDRAPSTP